MYTFLADARKGRDGLAIAADGMLFISPDGRIAIHDCLLDVLKQFTGRYVDVEFFFRKESPIFDDGIQPLVDALRALGLTTLASCEGHWEAIEGRNTDRYPYVVFYGQPPKILTDSLSPGWMITGCEHSFYTVRPKEMPKDKQELETRQVQALELAEKINKSIT